MKEVVLTLQNRSYYYSKEQLVNKYRLSPKGFHLLGKPDKVETRGFITAHLFKRDRVHKYIESERYKREFAEKLRRDEEARLKRISNYNQEIIERAFNCPFDIDPYIQKEMSALKDRADLNGTDSAITPEQSTYIVNRLLDVARRKALAFARNYNGYKEQEIIAIFQARLIYYLSDLYPTLVKKYLL